MQNETLLEIIEKTEEFMEDVQDAVSQLQEEGLPGLADDLRRGLLADLEMRLNNNHHWMARRSPTLQEMLKGES